MKNILDRLLLFILFWVIIVIICSTYVYVAPVQVLSIYNAPLPLVKTKIKPGDTLEYLIDYCKHLSISGTVKRSLINTTLVQYSETEAAAPPGCKKGIRVGIPLPLYLTPGKYKLVTRIDYKTSILHTETYIFETQEFEIL